MDSQEEIVLETIQSVLQETKSKVYAAWSAEVDDEQALVTALGASILEFGTTHGYSHLELEEQKLESSSTKSIRTPQKAVHKPVFMSPISGSEKDEAVLHRAKDIALLHAKLDDILEQFAKGVFRQIRSHRLSLATEKDVVCSFPPPGVALANSKFDASLNRMNLTEGHMSVLKENAQLKTEVFQARRSILQQQEQIRALERETQLIRGQLARRIHQLSEMRSQFCKEMAVLREDLYQYQGQLGRTIAPDIDLRSLTSGGEARATDGLKDRYRDLLVSQDRFDVSRRVLSHVPRPRQHYSLNDTDATSPRSRESPSQSPRDTERRDALPRKLSPAIARLLAVIIKHGASGGSDGGGNPAVASDVRSLGGDPFEQDPTTMAKLLVERIEAEFQNECELIRTEHERQMRDAEERERRVLNEQRQVHQQELDDMTSSFVAAKVVANEPPRTEQPSMRLELLREKERDTEIEGLRAQLDEAETQRDALRSEVVSLKLQNSVLESKAPKGSAKSFTSSSSGKTDVIRPTSESPGTNNLWAHMRVKTPPKPSDPPAEPNVTAPHAPAARVDIAPELGVSLDHVKAAVRQVTATIQCALSRTQGSTSEQDAAQDIENRLIQTLEELGRSSTERMAKTVDTEHVEAIFLPYFVSLLQSCLSRVPPSGMRGLVLRLIGDVLGSGHPLIAKRLLRTLDMVSPGQVSFLPTPSESEERVLSSTPQAPAVHAAIPSLKLEAGPESRTGAGPSSGSPRHTVKGRRGNRLINVGVNEGASEGEAPEDETYDQLMHAADVEITPVEYAGTDRAQLEAVRVPAVVDAPQDMASASTVPAPARPMRVGGLDEGGHVAASDTPDVTQAKGNGESAHIHRPTAADSVQDPQHSAPYQMEEMSNGGDVGGSRCHDALPQSSLSLAVYDPPSAPHFVPALATRVFAAVAGPMASYQNVFSDTYTKEHEREYLHLLFYRTCSLLPPGRERRVLISHIQHELKRLGFSSVQEQSVMRAMQAVYQTTTNTPRGSSRTGSASSPRPRSGELGGSSTPAESNGMRARPLSSVGRAMIEEEKSFLRSRSLPHGQLRSQSHDMLGFSYANLHDDDEMECIDDQSLPDTDGVVMPSDQDEPPVRSMPPKESGAHSVPTLFAFTDGVTPSQTRRLAYPARPLSPRVRHKGSAHVHSHELGTVSVEEASITVSSPSNPALRLNLQDVASTEGLDRSKSQSLRRPRKSKDPRKIAEVHLQPKLTAAQNRPPRFNPASDGEHGAATRTSALLTLSQSQARLDPRKGRDAAVRHFAKGMQKHHFGRRR